MATSTADSARVPRLVDVFNPLARRLLRVGVPLGPNALLTVKGRKSGQPRTTPVALVEVHGRRWLVGAFGDVNWVRNLRAAGEGELAVGRRTDPVKAVELTTDETTAFFAGVLGPYVHSLRFGAWLLGSVLGAKDVLEDPAGAARRHPVFELHAAA